MDWGPPNYTPEGQDPARPANYDLILDGISEDPAPERHFLQTKRFKVLVLIGLLWIVAVFADFRSSIHSGHRSQFKQLHRKGLHR